MSKAPQSPAPIKRRLIHRPPGGKDDVVIAEDTIGDLSGPIVILGDPGLGKSVLTRALGSQTTNHYVRAGTFVRAHDPKVYLPTAGGRLVIDGLDEVASATPGGGIHDVLRQLSALGNPPFILSSREADWAGAAARVQIEDDYGQAVQLLRLQPFDRDDAAQFLAANFPSVDADAVLEHLANHGLEEIYGNPLTLRMIGEVADAEEALPQTRSALLERACALMLVEANERHHAASHTKQAAESLLLGAGTIAAGLLLCDCAAAFTGPIGGATAEVLPLAEIERLPLASAAGEALKTRLFQADGENRFAPIHRVVAEYLAARWLAAVVDGGASKRRVLSLLSLGGGVPTSLRGVNAWLAHFSAILALDCIAADPYAVLRYGDAESLPLDQARQLLQALTRLSETDPYFREGGAGRHAATGLLRVELKDQILAVITNEGGHALLSQLLLEGLDTSPLLPLIKPEIERILLDPDASAPMRLRALAALSEGGQLTSPEPLLKALLDRGDGQSNASAFRILEYGRIDSVSPWVAARTLLAAAGVTVSYLPQSEDDDHAPYIRADTFEGVAPAFLRDFLDGLTACAEPLMRDAERPDREAVANAARLAVVQLLDSDPLVAATDVWRWLSWTAGVTAFDKKSEELLNDRLLARPNLIREIQEQAVFETPLEDLRYRVIFNLHQVSHALAIDDATLIALMNAYAARAGEDIDLERLQAVALLALRQDGLPTEVSDAAIRLAGGKRAFARALAARSEPFKDPYAAKTATRLAATEKSRKAKYATIRAQHQTNIAEIRAGDPRYLEQDAQAYLGRFYEFDKNAAPMERLEAFLGVDLAEEVATAFMTSLLRDDLPSALSIAETHADGRHWLAEIAAVCGIAERLRRGLGLDLPQAVLESSYMAWRRQRESNIIGGVDIAAAIEPLILHDDASVERFFRTSIEPQLKARQDHIDDLYKLTHEAPWRALAGRLACEWLMRFPILADGMENELLDCAFRYADGASLDALVTWGRTQVHGSRESVLNWLPSDFALDFKLRQKDLENAAIERMDFLWRLRTRVIGSRHGAWPALSLAQLRFIVTAFTPVWPWTPRPSGATSGNTNTWDATDFIESAIYRIAADPSAAASDILRGLMAGSTHGYERTLMHALAEQMKLRRDHEYVPATPEALYAVVDNGPPDSIDDMRAFFGDRVTTVSKRMHATNTDMWEAYWDGDKPRGENFCRNRLIEHIYAALPATVRFEPEQLMPGQTRADIAAIRNSVGLPVEIKGQWHDQVWDAASNQLKVQYARAWQAEGRGAYIVLWFGDVPGKQLKAHPDGLERPTTPAVLREMLIDRIPESDRDLIDVYVVDVSRLAKIEKK